MRDAFRFSSITLAALVGSIVLSLVLVGVPRLIDDDPCLREADVDCTSAGGVLQALDVAGVLIGAIATRMVAIVLVIVVATEAVNYRSVSRRRDRRRRSTGRVDEEPRP
ncbi:MAG: hypothetical protein AAF081_15440 [Actinomycetota bacterium]